MNTDKTTLADLVRTAGWPIRIDIVSGLLEKADEVLADKGGRDYTGPLTEAEITALGFELAR